MATLFTVVFALGGWFSGFGRGLSDNSFFWHLQTGHWILDHGAVPRGDIYSFTVPGQRWVAQSWLAEALYAVLDRTLGALGMRFLGAVTGALLGALAYRLALRLARDRLFAAGLTLSAVAASFTLWNERPLFLGILAFVGLLWIIELPASRLGRHALLALPVLLWLWANIHGTFALGFVYLGFHLAGRWLDGFVPWRGREWDVARGGAVALAVCLVNPYGPALLLFPFDLVSRGEILRHVSEWMSPDFRGPQGMTYAVWLAVFVSCLVLGRTRPSRRDLVVSLPFMLLALWAQRNIALAPLVGLPVAARAIAAPQDRPEPGGALGRPLAAALLILGLLATANAAAEPDYQLRGYPVAAVRALESQGRLGERLLTTDAWAGWVILRYWPRQKVFLDDRYDMYPTRLTKEYIRFAEGKPGWEKVLDRYQIDVVVWKRDTAVAELMEQQEGWRRVHRDRLAVVYERR